MDKTLSIIQVDHQLNSKVNYLLENIDDIKATVDSFTEASKEQIDSFLNAFTEISKEEVQELLNSGGDYYYYYYNDDNGASIGTFENL